MNKKRSKLMAAILMCLLCLTMLLPTTASAASQKKVTVKTIKSGTTLQVGETRSASVKVNTKSSLSYKTSNKKVVTVSKKGKLTAKKPGTAKITVTATPKSKKYKKTTKSITIKVVPTTPKTLTAKRSGNTITATVSKVKYASGFQFQYSLNENMSGAKSKTVKSRSYKFNASTDKDYFVRARAYTKVGKKDVYSSWSSVCAVKKGSSGTTTTDPTPAPTPAPTPETECSHSWDSGIVTKQPTCGTAGEKKMTCTKCGETKTETVAALGHDWIIIPEKGHYGPLYDRVGIELCDQCGKGYTNHIRYPQYGANLTDEEIEAAGYEVVDDQKAAMAQHLSESPECSSSTVEFLSLPGHGEMWVVDVAEHGECSRCDASWW